MIDIHSHILPGIDDGARSMEEAVAMVRQAAAGGTTDMVATPHWNHSFRFDPAKVDEAIAALQLAAGPSVRIHYGCELHLTPETIHEANRFPANYSIARGTYLLVEFSDALVPRTVNEIFRAIQLAGRRPVIAHPERNPILRQSMGLLANWVDQGCVVQLTGGSLLGHFGKAAQETAADLIERGLAHFVASDAHDLGCRSAGLNLAWNCVVDRFGESVARLLLLENPQAALVSGVVRKEVSWARRRRWFEFWPR